MGEASRKVLFLTGAPSPGSLGWSEIELCAPLQSCFSESSRRPRRLTSDVTPPSWRALPLEQPYLPTGLTQPSGRGRPFEADGGNTEETSFFTATDLSFISTTVSEHQHENFQASAPENEELLSQYYEHSFAVHEDIASSQMVGAGSFIEVSFDTEAGEYSLDFSINSEIQPEEQLVRSRLASGYLSDLKDMPKATYLDSITPQTMTVNLVVGIISISQPRTIITRKGGRTVELVEMLVGDNTRAGFGMTVWLPPLQESNDGMQREADLRSRTSQLRPQDIVLVRTVALSSFKGKVYGQSLRRGTTTLDLLYRNVVAEDDKRGTYKARDLGVEAISDLQVLKVKRVKDWVMQFVGASAGLPALGNGSLSRMRREKLQALPSDTP